LRTYNAISINNIIVLFNTVIIERKIKKWGQRAYDSYDHKNYKST